MVKCDSKWKCGPVEGTDQESQLRKTCVRLEKKYKKYVKNTLQGSDDLRLGKDETGSEDTDVHRPLFFEERVTDKSENRVPLSRGSYDCRRTFVLGEEVREADVTFG